MKEKMLTLNMSGKMEGFDSLSTSCKANTLCQARIAKAIKDIRNHSEKAAEIIDRYLLPSEDKKHISGTKAAKALTAIGCPVCVCVFCYADKAQNWQKSARDKFTANGNYLAKLRKPCQLPDVEPRQFGNIKPFRFEAEGDLFSVNQALNYIEICNKPQHQDVNFAMWTKNPGYIWQAVKKAGGKPKNLILVLSSRYIDTPDYKTFYYYNKLCRETFGYDLFNKLFTVCTKEGIEKLNAVFNCCGSRADNKCKRCLRCYNPDDETIFIFELLR